MTADRGLALDRRRLLGGGIGLLAASPAQARTSARGPGAGPWRPARPEDHGLSASALEAAAARIGATGERQGLVIIRHGRLVFERYWETPYARATPEWRNVSFSAGKSFGATMVGRAITEGLLKLDDLAARYHPPERSGLKPDVTIRHMLTMTSGGTLNVKPSSVPPRRLDDPGPPGPGVEYAWQPQGEPGSPPGYGISIPPGRTFYYDGAVADHLADVVAAASGMTSHRYMMTHVVRPLGCERLIYQPEGIDRAGNIRLGGSILLSCRDLARLGQLYLDGGRWGGRTLIDAGYIREATSPSPLNPAYGFLWWLNGTGRVPNAPRSMYMAAGARGQFCFVLPEQDVVVATMGFGRDALTAERAFDALNPALRT
ncbi:serine hydrolase domain-containing protein [Phenylobacterium sp. VNQ135]|uniref:serine hydrolase domain-containing protein n=1 Tax=Phenylobacterium sp. VNQ135 TaxID=3400922 RepID=UPI003C00C728